MVLIHTDQHFLLFCYTRTSHSALSFMLSRKQMRLPQGFQLRRKYGHKLIGKGRKIKLGTGEHGNKSCVLNILANREQRNAGKILFRTGVSRTHERTKALTNCDANMFAFLEQKETSWLSTRWVEHKRAWLHYEDSWQNHKIPPPPPPSLRTR